MAKLFISQPMNGLAEEEIAQKRFKLIAKACERIRESGNNEPVVVLDTLFKKAPNDARPLWYLGESIKILGSADFAYFAKGWEDARGCAIEHECCAMYGIKAMHEDETIFTASGN